MCTNNKLALLRTSFAKCVFLFYGLLASFLFFLRQWRKCKRPLGRRRSTQTCPLCAHKQQKGSFRSLRASCRQERGVRRRRKEESWNLALKRSSKVCLISVAMSLSEVPFLIASMEHWMANSVISVSIVVLLTTGREGILNAGISVKGGTKRKREIIESLWKELAMIYKDNKESRCYLGS